MTTRKELTAAIGARYRGASKSEKQKILDEFVTLTGFHRKHAIRALNFERAGVVGEKGRNRIYDEAVRQAMILLWEAADRVCGKRLINSELSAVAPANLRQASFPFALDERT
jgi:hypothetical protein